MERQVFHWIVPSPDDHNSWSWPSAKLGARRSVWISQVDAEAQLLLFSQEYYQGVGLKVEQLGPGTVA